MPDWRKRKGKWETYCGFSYYNQNGKITRHDI